MEISILAICMDSLTQIVLGAACGEAALGKKIGNKALLFGAIGGTIPDLDVILGKFLFNNEISALAFHRGLMHSFVFSILGAFFFGWLTHRCYDRGIRRGMTDLRDWIWLFFLALLTHPILDSFTPYGTQLFAPFSDYRVAFNTIAVVDPLYTLPFLLSLIVLMFIKRTHTKRRLWLKLGIGISSLYLLFTVFNKSYVDSIFEDSLSTNKVLFKRFQTQPTIFNNILWYGVAETRSFYYMGFYSLLDKDNSFKNWTKIEKQHHLIPMEDADLSKLAWFSNDYYNLKLGTVKGTYIYSDLRYPLLNPEDNSTSLFRFQVYKNKDRWDMISSRPQLNEDATFSSLFGAMLERLKGQ